MSSQLPALMIVNPAAGAARRRKAVRLDAVAAALRRGGFGVQVAATAAPGDATRLAREAVSAGVAAVFALGGDGTQREVAEGLHGSDVALGILASGTANVLAPALGLPRDALAAARGYRIVDGHLRWRALDVGITRSGGSPRERVFLMMASRGVDARALRRLRPGMKRRLGMFGVALSGLGECLLRGAEQFPYEADGECAEASFLSLQNIATYGAVVRLAPAADPFDGCLDLVEFGGRGRLATLVFAVWALAGRHARLASVRMRRVERLVLPGPGPVDLQLDGDAHELRPPVVLYRSAERLRVLEGCEPAAGARRVA